MSAKPRRFTQAYPPLRHSNRLRTMNPRHKGGETGCF